MKKKLLALGLALGLAGVFGTAQAVPGSCGWYVMPVERGCVGENYVECRTTFMTVMKSDGTFHCQMVTTCKAIGSCENVA